MQKKRTLIVALCLFLFVSSVSHIKAETILDDGPDDIWKVTYSADETWSADKGDYHDEIDFVNITKLTSGSDVIVQLNMGSAPVLDNNHGYYGTATLSLTVFPVMITFWANGENGSFFNIFIPGMSVNIEYNDTAAIESTDLNFVTDAASWSYGELNMPDIDTWDLHVFSFYSTQGWQDTWTTGEAYWDFYPNTDSPYSEDATNTDPPTQPTTEDADYNIPGFSLVESTLALVIMTGVVLIYRKKSR